MPERYIDLDEAMNNPDLDLITDYLANELPPERVEEVRRRLEEDAAFREYCAPIIAAWTARPPRPPMSDEEIRASWDRFRARAGILPVPAPRRRSRWLRWAKWVVVGFAAVFGAYLVLFILLDTIGPAWSDFMSHTTLTDSGRVMRLADGTRVRLGPGAKLRIHESVGREGRRVMKLERGTARFEVRPLGKV